eukprot:scaffold5919_cov118-Isochrysis_galbana.AAC.5
MSCTYAPRRANIRPHPTISPPSHMPVSARRRPCGPAAGHRWPSAGTGGPRKFRRPQETHGVGGGRAHLMRRPPSGGDDKWLGRFGERIELCRLL